MGVSSYTIKGDKIIGITKSGSKATFPKYAVDVTIKFCKERGINNKYLIAGILATIAKESKFTPVSENLNYSPKGLINTFPSFFSRGSYNANEYARKPEKIANLVYGNRAGSGHTVYGEGWKFRGRGFNQITFKSNYTLYGKKLNKNLVDKPDLLISDVDVASLSSIEFYLQTFKDFKKNIIKNYKVSDVHSVSNYDLALRIIINLTAGGGYSPSAQVVIDNLNKAREYHQFLINYLEGNPSGKIDTSKPEYQIQQSEYNLGGEDDNELFSESPSRRRNTDFDPKILTQLFEPTIKPTYIEIEASVLKYDEKKDYMSGFGTSPFVYYNGFHIEYEKILFFDLYHEGIIPALRVTFEDSWGIMRDKGFPNDDTCITIVLYSRTKRLRSIYMDFKITSFIDNNDNTYTLICISDIQDLFIRKFSSYSKMTSHQALQEVAKECGLGFCSNVGDSDDIMTWINVGDTVNNFINDTIKKAYIADNTFVDCYIDFYYNLCYVDMEKEISRDLSEDRMIPNGGLAEFTNKPNEDESTSHALLSNDKSVKNTNSYISEFNVINKSAKVSINNSFMTKAKYYKSSSKELLIFDIDTISNSENLVLKGRPQDDSYYRRNIRDVYMGKIDTFEDGNGNVHDNILYASVQNEINLNEIDKISMICKIPNPNYNLYINQSILVAITKDKPGLTHDDIFYQRLNGKWIIRKIIYKSENKSFYQEVLLNRRDLNKLDGE